MSERRDPTFFDNALTRTRSMKGDEMLLSYFRGETSLIELHEFTWGEPILTMVRIKSKQHRKFRPDVVSLEVEGWFYEMVDDPEMPFGQRKEYSPITVPVSNFPKAFRQNMQEGNYFWADARLDPENKAKVILSNPRLSPAKNSAA